jgi:acylphosphatase
VNDDRVAKRVVVHGDVQGVFFRDSTEKEAQKHGVSGWVTNRDDGAVEALFEGDASSVDAMVDFAKSGPSQASVQDVEVSDAEPEGGSSFEVK